MANKSFWRRKQGAVAAVCLLAVFIFALSGGLAARPAHSQPPSQEPKLDLKVEADPKTATLGQTVNLTYTVANKGTVPLRVTVTDITRGETVIDGVYLEAGGQQTETAYYLVTESDVGGGGKEKLEFTGRADGVAGDGGAVTESDTATVNLAGTSLRVGEGSGDFGAAGLWQRVTRYDWALDKECVSSDLQLPPGGYADAEFTVLAARSVSEEDRVGVGGNITVLNTGDYPTYGLRVELQVQYKQSGNSQFTDLPGAAWECEPGDPIPAGGSATFDYNIWFDPVEGADAYRVKAELTVLNHSGRLGEPFGPGPCADFDLPQSPDEVVEGSSEAAITDEVTCPAGFSVEGPEPSNWTASGDGTPVTVRLRVHNEGAGAGTYTLTNVARLSADPVAREDGADLSITVPADQNGDQTGGDNGGSGGETPGDQTGGDNGGNGGETPGDQTGGTETGETQTPGNETGGTETTGGTGTGGTGGGTTAATGSEASAVPEEEAVTAPLVEEEVVVPEEEAVLAPLEAVTEPVKVPAEQTPAAPKLPFTGGYTWLYLGLGAGLILAGAVLKPRKAK